MAESTKQKILLLNRSKGKLRTNLQPIVLDYKERHKKKKTDEEKEGEQYSEGLEDIQRMEGDVIHIAQRSARALSKSLDTYEQERKRSAKERKDGAIEDFVHNSAKAANAYLKEASEIPLDIADSVNTESYRKRLRDNLRQASRVIRLFRI